MTGQPLTTRFVSLSTPAPMTSRPKACQVPVKPAFFFVIILGLTFGIEAGIMLALTEIVEETQIAAWTAIVDACLLTLGLAPFVWFVFVFR